MESAQTPEMTNLVDIGRAMRVQRVGSLWRIAREGRKYAKLGKKACMLEGRRVGGQTRLSSGLERHHLLPPHVLTVAVSEQERTSSRRRKLWRRGLFHSFFFRIYF